MRHALVMAALLGCCCLRLDGAAVTTGPTTAATTAPVARVPETFRGWVNLTDHDDPKEIPRNSYSTVDLSDARFDAQGNLRFGDKATNRWIYYEAKTNTIYITRMHPVELAQTFDGIGRDSMLSVSFDALQSDWLRAGGSAVKSVEGQFDRYDVTFASATQTFWFDPATKRLAAAQDLTAKPPWWQFYRYDTPAVRQVYDLGVPKNAKVVDNRPTGELLQVLDRIDGRFERGFGDGVALLTETPLDAAGKPVPNTGSITLYAQDGSKWLTHRFLAGGRQIELSRHTLEQAPRLALPLGWPTPAIAPLIPLLAVATPTDTYVSDGTKAWRADYDDDLAKLMDHAKKYGPLGSDAPGVRARILFSLHWYLWAGRDRLEGFNPKSGIRLQRDAKKRPGLIGLFASIDDRSYEFWLDPAKDDLLVEAIESRGRGPGTVLTNRHWTFETFAQLPGGRWYPTRWTYTDSMTAPSLNQSRTLVYHLQIAPALRLDAKWYANPIVRLGVR